MRKLFFILSMAFLFTACAESGRQGPQRQLALPPQFVINDLETHHFDTKPWTSLEALDSEEKFQFLVVTDRTGGMRAGVFEDAMTRIQLLQPAFVVSIGDLIEGYDYPYGYKEKTGLEKEWNAFDEIISSLDAPFFYTPGDHDFASQAMADVWEERLGRSFYHFIYKDTLFLILNSELFDRPHPAWHWKNYQQIFATQQAEQLAYIERVLSKNSDVRWTFVFVHKPFWRAQWVRPQEEATAPLNGPWPQQAHIPPEWPQVETHLQDRNYTLFAGHLHTYEFESDKTRSGFTHDRIALATTGGLSNLRGVNYGEFDHMVWVTMTKDGPIIANLLPEGVLPKNVDTSLQRPYWAE